RMESLGLKTNAGSQRSWSPASDLVEVKKIVADLASLRDEASRLERTAAAHELGDWIRRGFLHADRAAKGARRRHDFADLLLNGGNMLRGGRAARAAFQSRFDCLLVDEFQDTDPLQAEILFLLAADRPEISDWRQARPKPGKLFLVGDPKQS